MPRATGLKPEYDVTISDGSATVGIMVQGGAPSALRRLPRGPGVERKRAEQKDWTGGRGQERFSADVSRFYDSSGLWTLTPGQAINGPLMRFASVPWRTQITRWPKDLLIAPLTTYTWTQLWGGTKYFAGLLVPTAAGTIRRVTLILRKYGSPTGTYTVRLHSDTAAKPGAVLQTVTFAASVLTDYPSVMLELDFGANQALSASTAYWLTIGEFTNVDGSNNHVQVLTGNVGAPSCWDSTDGATWTNSGNRTIYHRLVSEPGAEQRRLFFFEYRRALYAAAAVPDAPGSAAIYRNGDRGVATGAQTTTTLKDTTKAWTTNQWKSITVIINSGALRGLARTIDSNTADTLTLTSGQTWPVAPATGAAGSEYILLGSDEWSAVGAVTLNDNPTDVAVLNDTVYVAGGDDANITRFREFNNAGVWTVQEADDGANKAALLETFQEGNKTFVYRVNNDTINFSRAPAVAWGTNLTFEAGAPAGDTNALATGITVYDDAVHIAKEDSIYVVRNGIATKLPVPIDTARDLNNGAVLRGWHTNLFFSFLDGLERLYGRTVDDIGPNRDQGLPDGRRGVIADLVPVLQNAFAALDGGLGLNNTSAIFATISPGGAWHELYRMPAANLRIQSLYYQSVPLLVNRLWFQAGHDLCSLLLPSTPQNPLNDNQMRYNWDGYVTTSWIDYDTIDLDHCFAQLRLFTRGLYGSGINGIEADYQLDNASDYSAWTPFANWFYTSPTQTQAIGVSGAQGRRLRLRLRLLASNASLPVVLNGLQVRADQMNEVLYDYTLDLTLNDRLMLLDQGEARAAGDQAAAVLAQLAAWQENAIPLTLRCRHPLFDNIRGHIDPVAIVPANWDPDESRVAGSITFRQL